jgi:hypothetical protein
MWCGTDCCQYRILSKAFRAPSEPSRPLWREDCEAQCRFSTAEYEARDVPYKSGAQLRSLLLCSSPELALSSSTLC